MTKSATGLTRAEERTLVGKAQAGDGAALETLLERYEPMVYRFSMRMCRDPEDARDVLQETLLSAVRGLEGFRGEARLSTWLYAIARSYCLKRRRGPRAEAVVSSLDGHAELEGSERSPDEAAGDRELLLALDRATATLDPDSRAVLLLRDVEGLSANETAQTLEMTVPQVKSRLHRARAAVRQQMLPALQQLQPIEGQLKDNCPDVVDMFSRYLEDDISTGMCAQMQDHIADCEYCRTTCDSLKRTVKVCQTAPTPDVPRDVVVALRHAIRRHVEVDPQGDS